MKKSDVLWVNPYITKQQQHEQQNQQNYFVSKNDKMCCEVNNPDIVSYPTTSRVFFFYESFYKENRNVFNIKKFSTLKDDNIRDNNI